jgi:hypothetical protein
MDRRNAEQYAFAEKAASDVGEDGNPLLNPQSDPQPMQDQMQQPMQQPQEMPMEQAPMQPQPPMQGM